MQDTDLNPNIPAVSGTRKQTSRGKNWSSVEDEALCMAWLDVSQDPIISVDQKADTFYERVFASFSTVCKEKRLLIDPDTRGPTSLKARWSIILRSVNKFCGFYAQVRSRNQSGTTLSDQLTEALVLYKEDQKTNFQLMHAYRILESAPKWKEFIKQKEVRLPIMKCSFLV